MTFSSPELDHLSNDGTSRGPTENKLTSIPDFTQITSLLVPAVRIDGLSATSSEDGGYVVKCETCNAYFISVMKQPERERGECECNVDFSCFFM